MTTASAPPPPHDGRHDRARDRDVRLAIRLPRPSLELDVAPGEIVQLPDDGQVIAALRGDAPSRRTVAVVRLDGRNLARRSRSARVRAGLVVVGGAEVAPDVTVLEHLAAVCGHASAVDRLRDAPHLADRGDDAAGILSGGERVVLDWLVADTLRPRAVVLDGAATGLDRTAQEWAHQQLDAWADAGIAALLRVRRDDERRWLTHRADGTRRAADPRV